MVTTLVLQVSSGEKGVHVEESSFVSMIISLKLSHVHKDLVIGFPTCIIFPISITFPLYLGTADFVPEPIGHGGGKTRCETVSQTMDKANRWISQQQGIRLVNILTLNYKTKGAYGGMVYHL